MKKLYRILVVVLVLLLVVSVFVACDSHQHNYDQIGSDAQGHWNYCKEDNAIDEDSRAAHVDANCDGKCDVCQYEVGIPHTHEYNVVKNDESYHWNECSCGEKDKSSIASHEDNDKNGKCDGCDFDMPVPEEEYIGIEEIEGVPTLVVKGAIPSGVECIKLHYDANGQNYFVENSATDSVSFIFNLPLSQLPTDDTPWCWFHVYTYSVATPSDEDAFNKTDLMREEWLEAGHVYNYNKVDYVVVSDESTNGMVVIQPKPVAEIAQTELSFDLSGVPAVVVKGTASSAVKAVAIHVDGNDDDEWFGELAVVSNGTFEARFEINKIKLDGTPWGWFHLYAYKSENVEDLTQKAAKIDISRGDKETGKLVDYNGVRYSVIDQNQLVIQPNNAPDFEVTGISVSENAILTIKGAMNKNEVAALVIHADGNGTDWYGDVGHTVNGEFELTFDLTQLRVSDTPWCYVHIYSYADAEPSDLSAKVAKEDMKIGSFVSYGLLVEYNGVDYYAVSNDWGSLIIQPKPAE